MSRPRIVCVLLALITLAVYLPVRHYPFVNYDDGIYVTDNPMVQAGLTWAGIKYAFTSWYGNFWHPLTCLSHMLDCQLFGLNAGGPHLVNVFFHAANTVLLFLLLLRLTGTLWPGAFIAALFAWHPLRVESVAWVAERKDVLSVFFGLLSMLAYVGYAQKPSNVERRRPGGNRAVTKPEVRHPRRDYALAVLFFALGLMCKPMLVTLPFVLLLLDYWPLQRVPVSKPVISGWSRLVFEKWPFFALTAASCVLTLMAKHATDVMVPLQKYPLPLRLESGAVSYMNYLIKTFYPADLAVIYPMPREIPGIQVMLATVLLVVVSWLVWWGRQRRPYLLMGWLWFLGMLLPVIGLTQVGMQAMADRFTYLPLVGVFIGVAFGLNDLVKKLRLEPMMLFLAAAIVLTGCLAATARQLEYWQNSEALFRHALKVTRDNSYAQSYLGNVLLQNGQVNEAIVLLQKSIELDPDDSQAHNNLGWAYMRERRVEEAIAEFQRALEIEPGSAKLHFNLGAAYDRAGETDKAIEQYQTAVKLQPDLAQARNNLGDALLRTGRTDEALAQFQEAVSLMPNSTMIRNNLGEALLREGEVGEAVAQFEKSLAIRADNMEACWNMARVLATCPEAKYRDGQRAVEMAQQASQLSGGKKPEVEGTLAAAYAEAGRYAEAVTAARQALQLAAAQNDAVLTGALQTQMGYYQAGLPFQDVTLTNAQPPAK